MKTLGRISCFALLTVAALSPTWAQGSGGGLRYTIAVTDFENQSGYAWHWDLGYAWETVMTDLLQQTGRFIVLGESDMRAAALDEQDLGASGRTAQGAKTPEIGQLTPAQILVKGAITHAQVSGGGGGGFSVKGIRIGGGKESATINATVYVIDSTTGQVLASKDVESTSAKRGGRLGYSGHGWSGDADAFKNDNVGKALEDGVSQAVEWIESQLPNIPWRGSVAVVQDGSVYVNRGTREGVAPGQTFVVGSETVIRDPDTGEELDRSVERVAELRCDTVKEKLSICAVTGGDAAAVEQGMAVHLP
ncbi:MAG: CsgG/HfaB family protein [Thermoanaerobaculia bacterium]